MIVKPWPLILTAVQPALIRLFWERHSVVAPISIDCWNSQPCYYVALLADVCLLDN